MSLTICETAYCQTFIRNRWNEIVGVIDGKDTLHAIPIAESRVVHEYAIRKIYLDSMVVIKNDIITNLESRLSMLVSGYENLLSNSGKTASELRKALQTAKDERNELKGDLRKHKRKLFWANVRTITVAVIGTVIIWLVGK